MFSPYNARPLILNPLRPVGRRAICPTYAELVELFEAMQDALDSLDPWETCSPDQQEAQRAKAHSYRLRRREAEELLFELSPTAC